MDLLSVVLPAYNEELMIDRACQTLDEVLVQAGISYELVFVDDGSSDRTWERIQKAGRRNPHITGVRFSRNFGKEAAIFAGLAQARGNAVAVMDCDLQHPPETLVDMYKLWRQGYEVVEGMKTSRGEESMLHKKCAGFFYGLLSKAMGADMRNTSDFKLLDRKAVNAVLSMPEKNMFFRGTTSWIGFRRAEVEFQVQEREAGESKWNSWSLIKYGFQNIVAFTTMPLQFVTVTGFICLGFSLALLIYSLVQFFRGRAVEGYTTIIIVLLLIGSAIMVSLGIIGYYIAKIYEETKGRPRYLISEIQGEVYRTGEKEQRHDQEAV